MAKLAGLVMLILGVVVGVFLSPLTHSSQVVAQQYTQADKDYAIALLDGINKAIPVLDKVYDDGGRGDGWLSAADRYLNMVYDTVNRNRVHVTPALLAHDSRIQVALLKTRTDVHSGPICWGPIPSNPFGVGRNPYNPFGCTAEAKERQQLHYYLQWLKNVLEIESQELQEIVRSPN